MKIFHNLGWKILSVLIAFALWARVIGSQPIEVNKEVALKYDLPPGMVISNDAPEKVTIRLSGPKFLLRQLPKKIDKIRINLTDASIGPNYYQIEKDAVQAPFGMRVLAISPSSVSPELETMLSRTVPVKFNVKRNLPKGFKLVKLVADPPAVRIRGPKSQIEGMDSIEPSTLNFNEYSSNLRWEVPLQAPNKNIVFDDVPAPKIIIEIEPEGSNFRIAGVPIAIEGGNKAKLSLDKVALYVQCPASLIQELTPDRVKAKVVLGKMISGIYLREIKVELPPGVKLVKVVPDRVQVQVE